MRDQTAQLSIQNYKDWPKRLDQMLNFNPMKELYVPNSQVQLKKIFQDYFFKNGIFNLIHSHASLPAALDLGWKPGASGIRKVKPDVLILLGADGRKVSRADLCNEYQIEGWYPQT